MARSAALVGITACCANISPASALIVGLIAGIITTVATIALERLQIDDAVGAVPVHLANGWWGTLSVALFNQDGFDAQKLGVQALGTFSITLSSFVICFAIFKVVDLVIGLRATEHRADRRAGLRRARRQRLSRLSDDRAGLSQATSCLPQDRRGMRGASVR
jgi:ammonia channel protein AmtB